MNPFKSSSLPSFTEIESVFSARECIEVKEDSEPLILKLDQIFGAIDLSFLVAVEDYGVVDTAFNKSTDELKLSVGQCATAGQHSHIVIQAKDDSGASTAMTFKVVVWPAARHEQLSA